MMKFRNCSDGSERDGWYVFSPLIIIASTIFHFVALGVVDHRMKVYNTDNLRIVDASVLPLSLGVAILSTVYAFAEKVRTRTLLTVLVIDI
jgi:hypothetical protein